MMTDPDLRPPIEEPTELPEEVPGDEGNFDYPGTSPELPPVSPD